MSQMHLLLILPQLQQGDMPPEMPNLEVFEFGSYHPSKISSEKTCIVLIQLFLLLFCAGIL